LARSSTGRGYCALNAEVGDRYPVVPPSCLHSSVNRASGFEPVRRRFESCWGPHLIDVAEWQGTGLQPQLRRSEPCRRFQYSPDSTNFHPRVAQSGERQVYTLRRRGSEALLADHLQYPVRVAELGRRAGLRNQCPTDVRVRFSPCTPFSSQVSVVATHSLRTVVSAVRFRHLAPASPTCHSTGRMPGCYPGNGGSNPPVWAISSESPLTGRRPGSEPGNLGSIPSTQAIFIET
jgi:hypothetical protein